MPEFKMSETVVVPVGGKVELDQMASKRFSNANKPVLIIHGNKNRSTYLEKAIQDLNRFIELKVKEEDAK